MKQYKWLNAEKTLISEQNEGDYTQVRIVEFWQKDFATLSGMPNVTPYVAPNPDPADILAQWRAGAIASQAQIRLTLHQLGLLETVQAIANADQAASIVWEYADSIRRASPFIDALKGEKFTDAQIDDIFRYAMGLEF